MKLSMFQLIVLISFVGFLLAGIAAFSLFGGNRGSSIGQVTIWGTLDQQTMQSLLVTLRSQNKEFQNVTYVQKDPSTYYTDLINAMASGTGPDLFFITQDTVTNFSNKITVIPYSAESQATYLSSFLNEGQLFLTPQGALALPFSIDPLVMYWNKDLFASAGIAQPPVYWSDFLSLAPQITSIDTSSNIARSAVALGSWKNITHAKMILSALFMEAGDPIMLRTGSGSLESVFGTTPAAAAENPASSALLFYTEFANPSKTTYSWNDALPQSRDAFAAGNVAVYFGTASDNQLLLQTNPNLNFGVALLPQIKGNATHLTFGELTGLAISRSASNPQGALAVAQALTSLSIQESLLQQGTVIPARSDISINTSANAAEAIFEQSAIMSQGWLDPDPSATDPLFENMIESVVTGQQDPAQAVAQASQAMIQLSTTAQ